MKHVKPSISVKYIIESYNGTSWEQEYIFTRIQQSVDELEKIRESLPECEFRLIRSEWQVIE